MTANDTLNRETADTGDVPSVVPPISWATIVPVAVLATAAAVFTASRYHLFGDELYFIVAGHHPSPGYADQGPLLPLLARTFDALPGDSLIVFRLPSVIVTVAAVIITALIAREMGGGRWAQALAAGAYATSPLLLGQANLLATNTFDAPLWVGISWCLVRWVRTRNDLLLLGAAVLTAVDLEVKFLVPVLWVGVVLGVLVAGPRELLRRPTLWIGGALVLAATSAGIWWQAAHGWPQLALGSEVAAEQEVVGGRLLFVPMVLVLAGVLGVPLTLCGTWALLRSARVRAYRFVGIAFLVVVIVFLIVGGRPYYPAGLLAAVMAAGSVVMTEAMARSQRPRIPVTITAVLAALAVAVLAVTLPWTPADRVSAPRDVAAAAPRISLYGQFGWRELTRDTESAYAEATAESTADGRTPPTAVITGSYWQASALAYYGTDLPPVYSPSRGFGYFGTPPDSATSVLVLDDTDDPPTEYCRDLRPLRTIAGRVAFPGAATDVTVWQCTVRAPWSQTWDSLRHI